MDDVRAMRLRNVGVARHTAMPTGGGS